MQYGPSPEGNHSGVLPLRRGAPWQPRCLDLSLPRLDLRADGAFGVASTTDALVLHELSRRPSRSRMANANAAARPPTLSRQVQHDTKDEEDAKRDEK